jgi:hypothetical protein
MVTFARLAELAVKLPDVELSRSSGAPSLTARGKMMLRLRDDGETIVLRMDRSERQALTESDPDTFFYTEEFRDYPLVLVRLAKLSEAALPALLERAWHLAAPDQTAHR